MAKSSFTLCAAALASAAQPAAAQETMTAEEVVEAFEKEWPTVAKLDCPQAADPDEIVVCARRERYRIGPSERPIGSRTPGETLRGSEALALGSERCSTVGRNQSCSGGLPLIPIALFAIDAAGKALRALKGDD